VQLRLRCANRPASLFSYLAVFQAFDIIQDYSLTIPFGQLRKYFSQQDTIHDSHSPGVPTAGGDVNGQIFMFGKSFWSSLSLSEVHQREIYSHTVEPGGEG